MASFGGSVGHQAVAPVVASGNRPRVTLERSVGIYPHPSGSLVETDLSERVVWLDNWIKLHASVLFGRQGLNPYGYQQPVLTGLDGLGAGVQSWASGSGQDVFNRNLWGDAAVQFGDATGSATYGPGDYALHGAVLQTKPNLAQFANVAEPAGAAIYRTLYQRLDIRPTDPAALAARDVLVYVNLYKPGGGTVQTALFIVTDVTGLLDDNGALPDWLRLRIEFDV